jgi:hypothetical protein
MLLILPMTAYSNQRVFFSSAVKNNVIDNSLFIRLLYSCENYTMNGIYLKQYTSEDLRHFEKDLLEVYNPTKVKSLSLAEHFADHSTLKISGIWETPTSIGLAYKFNHQF